MNRLHLSQALSLAFAVGCTGQLPAAPSASPAPPEVATPVGAAALSALPTAAPEAPVRSAFTKVAMVGDAPTLYRLGKRVFIGRGHGATFLEVKNGKIERADAVSPGLSVCKADNALGFEQPGSLYGDFDKKAWLSRLVYGARTTFISLQEWNGAGWRPSNLHEYSGQMRILGSYPWRKSTVLLVTWFGNSSQFDVLEGSDKRPSFTPMPEPRGWQQTRMLVAAAVKTHDGELVTAGSDGHVPLVERWSEAKGEGKLEWLPLAAGEDGGGIASLAGTSSHDIFAGGHVGSGKPYLAHFDGKQWTRVDAPFATPITNLSLGPDGALWAVERVGSVGDEKPTTLWRRTNGAWARIPASDEQGKPLVIGDLWALEDGDVWLSAAYSLYRSRPADTVFAWSDPLCPAISMARPATENCRDSVFVLFYTLAKTTPKDYDFPLLRQAIKGHRAFAKVSFAETEERGRRYFVGFLDSDAPDRLELGNKLVSLVKKEVKGSTPALLCGSPRVVRELKVDVVSGDVLKN